MRVVDENKTNVVDTSTKVYDLEEVRNAKAVRSVVEKLYGIRYSLIEVLNENALYREEASRTV